MSIDENDFEFAPALRSAFRAPVSRETTEQHLQLLWAAQDGLLPEIETQPRTSPVRALVGAAAVAVTLSIGASVTLSTSEPMIAIDATLEGVDNQSLATPVGDEDEVPLLAVPADEEPSPENEPSVPTITPADSPISNGESEPAEPERATPDTERPSRVATTAPPAIEGKDASPAEVPGSSAPTTSPPTTYSPPAETPNGPPMPVPSTGPQTSPPTNPATTETTPAPSTNPPPTTTPPTTTPPTIGPPTTEHPGNGSPGEHGTPGPSNPEPPKATPTSEECAGQPATILGTPGDDTIVGTSGPDVIVAGNGNDTIYGLSGDDIICAGNGNDIVYGGNGDDQLFGENGNDLLYGDDGDDWLNPGRGKAKSA